jgi:hypothetical protein
MLLDAVPQRSACAMEADVKVCGNALLRLRSALMRDVRACLSLRNALLRLRSALTKDVPPLLSLMIAFLSLTSVRSPGGGASTGDAVDPPTQAVECQYCE